MILKTLFLFIVFIFSGSLSAQDSIDYKGYLEKRGDKYVKLGPVDGEHTLYRPDKQLAASGFFKNSRLVTGKKYFFDPEGILTRIAVYRDGKYVGDVPMDEEPVKDTQKNHAEYEDSLRKVIAFYTKQIKTDPKNDRAYMKRADAESVLGWEKFHSDELAKARADYDKAITLNPGNDTAYNNRGELKMLKNQSDSVDNAILTDFDMAIKLCPTYVQAYYNRGFYLYCSEGSKQDAIPDFDKAIELDPGMAAAYNFRAFSKFFSGKQGFCADWKRAAELGYDTSEEMEKYCK